MEERKLNAMSEEDLRTFADREGIDDFQDMSREEITEALMDSDEPGQSVGNNARFNTTLTGEGETGSIADLPGTTELPETYNETSIHLLLKDVSWAYAYWSVSATDRLKMESSGSRLVLRALKYRTGEEEPEDFFDINISFDDKDWLFNLPGGNHTYKTMLLKATGEDLELLAESVPVSTATPYWAEHLDELRNDNGLFTLAFSPVTMKGHIVIDNLEVRSIVNSLSGGNS